MMTFDTHLKLFLEEPEVSQSAADQFFIRGDSLSLSSAPCFTDSPFTWSPQQSIKYIYHDEQNKSSRKRQALSLLFVS